MTKKAETKVPKDPELNFVICLSLSEGKKSKLQSFWKRSVRSKRKNVIPKRLELFIQIS